MKNFKMLIDDWIKLREQLPKDQEALIGYCNIHIKRLKRINLIADLFDIFLKAVGFLLLFGGIILFFFSIDKGDFYSFILSCVAIFFSFKVARGLE